MLIFYYKVNINSSNFFEYVIKMDHGLNIRIYKIIFIIKNICNLLILKKIEIHDFSGKTGRKIIPSRIGILDGFEIKDGVNAISS